MYAQNIASLYYPLGYETCKQASNPQIHVLYKDVEDRTNIILLINNYGKNRVRAASNLTRIVEKIKMNLFFNSRENVQVLSILFNHWKKDKINLLGMSNTIVYSAEGTVSYNHCSVDFIKEVQALKAYRKEQNVQKKLVGLNSNKRPHGIPVLTILLISVCALTYFLKPDATLYGISAKNVIRDGNYTCIFTYMFLHTNLIHLLGNVSVLIWAGSMTERRIGHFRFLALALLSGAYAGLLDAMFNMSNNSSVATIGLSGVVYAILASLLVYQIKCRQHYIPLIIYLVCSLGIGSITPNVNNNIHFIGLICGFYFMIVYAFEDAIRKKRTEGQIYKGKRMKKKGKMAYE